MIAGLSALGVEHHLDDALHASLGRFQAGDIHPDPRPVRSSADPLPTGRRPPFPVPCSLGSRAPWTAGAVADMTPTHQVEFSAPDSPAASGEGQYVPTGG